MLELEEALNTRVTYSAGLLAGKRIRLPCLSPRRIGAQAVFAADKAFGTEPQDMAARQSAVLYAYLLEGGFVMASVREALLTELAQLAHRDPERTSMMMVNELTAQLSTDELEFEGHNVKPSAALAFIDKPSWVSYLSATPASLPTSRPGSQPASQQGSHQPGHQASKPATQAHPLNPLRPCPPPCSAARRARWGFDDHTRIVGEDGRTTMHGWCE